MNAGIFQALYQGNSYLLLLTKTVFVRFLRLIVQAYSHARDTLNFNQKVATTYIRFYIYYGCLTKIIAADIFDRGIVFSLLDIHGCVYYGFGNVVWHCKLMLRGILS